MGRASAEDGALQVDVVRGDDGYRVVVAGELDLHTCPTLIETLKPLATDGAVLLLDTTDVSFFDSTGLTCLLRAKDVTEEHGGSLQVVALSRYVDRVLRMTATYDVLVGAEPD